MAYNLIDEAWIPVRRQSGVVERIAPWQVVDPTDPPLLIESGRPDFDAALLELMIGLVQTVATPEDSEEWAQIYESEFKQEELRERMRKVHDAFWLDGDGPRFMQDLEVHQDPKVESKPIANLLIDRGANSDAALFSNYACPALGLPAAAAAILTLQIFSPAGGRGQLTSLRGGGPLSVTIRDSTLWKTIWCNVLEREDLEALPGDHSDASLARIFPWMQPTRTGRQGTYPEHVHPLHHYFGLPRRYRLVFEGDLIGDCAIHGDGGVPVIQQIFSRPEGTRYQGPFRHPLTPYTVGKAGDEPNPRKGSKSGVPYRDWPLLTVGGEQLIPPKVVEAFLQRERWRFATAHRICARGYAMDKMKPLRFIEVESPLLHVPADLLPVLQEDASGLVEASEAVRRALLKQTKSAWSDRPSDLPGEAESRTDAAFWGATEQAFFDALRACARAIEAREDSARSEAKLRFLEAIHRAALEVFDSLCPMDVEEGAEKLALTVRARRTLAQHSHPSNRFLLKAIRVASDDPAHERRPARKERNGERNRR